MNEDNQIVTQTRKCRHTDNAKFRDFVLDTSKDDETPTQKPKKKNAVCPGFRNTPCSDNGKLHTKKNGYYTNKAGERVPKLRASKYCRKHLKEHNAATKRKRTSGPALHLQLRPAQNETIKALSLQVRNLEQKVDTMNDQLDSRSRQLGNHRSTIRRLSDQKLKQESKMNKLQVSLENELNLERRAFEESLSVHHKQTERSKNILQRHQQSIEKHKALLVDARRKTLSAEEALYQADQHQAQLMDNISTLQDEVAKLRSQVVTVRKRACEDPHAVAKKRADRLITTYFDRRGWAAADVLAVLGKVAAHYDFTAADITEACVRRKKQHKITNTSDHHGHSQTVSDRTVSRDAKKIEQLFETCTDRGAVLSTYLSRLDRDLLLQHLPIPLKQHLISKWVRQLEELWSPRLCAVIKGTCRMSNVAWTWQRHLLSYTVDEDGRLTQIMIDGVPVPTLRGRWSIDNIAREVAAVAGINTKDRKMSHGGLTSFVDARVLIEGMLQDYLADKTLPSVPVHKLKWSCDGAPAGKALNFTQMCLTLNPEQRQLGGSPLHTKVPAIFHGKDDAKSVWHFAKPAMDDISEIFESGEITVTVKSSEGEDEKVVCKIEPVLGCDEKAKCAANMHMGPAAFCGCWRCELERSHFLDTDVRSLAQHGGDTLRTVDSILLNAHMKTTNHCEACGMAVVATRAEMERLNAGETRKRFWKAIVVCVGDPMIDEPKPWETKTVNGVLWNWDKRHKSIYYGALGHRLMFPRLPLSCWVTCALHLRQRTTSLEVKCGICQWLDRGVKTKKGQDGPRTSILAQMFECMLTKGRKIPRMEESKNILSRKMSGRLLGLASMNFPGTTCKLIEKFGPLLVEAVIPASLCVDASSEAAINKQRCLTLFQNKVRFMSLYCVRRLEYGPNPTDIRIQQVREVHAKKVEEAGRSYVKSLAVLYPECQAWYPHAMAMHCGDDIRNHGCPIHFAQEADEAKNLETRNMLMDGTNKQVEHRLHTIMKKYSLLDQASALDERVSALMKRTCDMKVRRNETRKKTTAARISAKFEDTSTALELSKSSTVSEASSIVDSFNELQSQRRATKIEEQQIEKASKLTHKRRKK